jgi:hypothetical protein
VTPLVLIIDRTQRSHAPVSDIGAVLLGELFVPCRRERRVISELGEEFIENNTKRMPPPPL